MRNVGFIVEDGVNVLQKSGVLAFIDWEVRNKSSDLSVLGPMGGGNAGD